MIARQSDNLKQKPHAGFTMKDEKRRYCKQRNKQTKEEVLPKGVAGVVGKVGLELVTKVVLVIEAKEAKKEKKRKKKCQMTFELNSR